MHEVDFCRIIISFNSVLRGCVEVELERLEFTGLSLSVSKVQRTTVFVDVDFPRIVKGWSLSVFIILCWLLVLFILVTIEINTQISFVSLHCPVTEVDR